MPKVSGDAKGYVADLVDAIDEIASKNMSGEAYAKLKQARYEWRNYKAIEPLLEKSPDGFINPVELANKVASSKYIKASRLEVGKDNFVDLSRIGKQFFPKLGGSDTTQKAAALLAAKEAIKGVAGVAGIAGVAATPITPLAALPLVGMIANRGLQKVNQSQRLVDLAVKKSQKPLKITVRPRATLGIEGLAGTIPNRK